MPRIQFHHKTVPTETTLHLGPHGFVDAVFLLSLFDSFFGYIHDVGLGVALCRSSCGASHHYDTHRFSSLCSHNRVLLIPRTHPNSASLVVAFLRRNSVSPLVRSYNLSQAAVFDFYIFYSTTFRPLPQQSQHNLRFTVISVASSPECVFSPALVYTTSLFFSEVDLPLSRDLPRIIDHRRLLLHRNMHPGRTTRT